MSGVGYPDSIAVFGSTARRDADQMSDKDVLIVSDDDRTRRNVATRLRTNTWSPVCFTWRRLDRAAAGHGLFMQHLKLEACILRDRNNRLRELRDRFSVR